MFTSLFNASRRIDDAPAAPAAPSFAAFADLLPHPVWAADPDGAFTFVSARWAEVAGPGSALGDGWTALLPSAERGGTLAAFRQAVAGGDAFTLDVTLHLPGGPTACRLLARPRHGADAPGDWIGSLVVLHPADEPPADGAADAPASADAPTSTAPVVPPAAEAPAAGGRPRVLVVEDNPDTQYLIRRILRKNHEVSAASDFASAVEAARAGAHDILLVDIHLNDGTSGISLLQTLRALPGYADTPAAAVTAFGLPSEQERFLDAGFTRYLAKPFASAELLALVGELLDEADRAGGAS